LSRGKTETKETLDEFVDALLAIAQEIKDQPNPLKQAPFTTPVSRLDETHAAGRPVLWWKSVEEK